MAAQEAQELASLTATVAKGANDESSGPGEASAVAAHRRRLGRLSAAALVLLGVAGASAWHLRGRRQGAGAAAEAVERGEAESLAGLGPFGEYAGPAPPFGTGKLYYGVHSANMGSPPLPPEPHSFEKPPGCQGIGCNGGKLCCGKHAKCCGTSCCSGGSICCNENLGLCCAEGTMCCFRKFCCAPSFKCGDSRVKTGGVRYQVLQQCGGGAQIRRLVDEIRYKREFRKLLSTNETGLKALLGIPNGNDEAEDVEEK